MPEAGLYRSLASWLADSSAPNLEKLRALGDSLRSRHGDTTLSDLAAIPDPVAFAELGRSIAANQAGDYASALKAAAGAENHFRRRQNLAGQLFAAVEQVYARHWLLQSHECVENATAVAARLERFPTYRWLAAQNRVELAVCLAMSGRPGTAIDTLTAAVEAAQRAGFADLYLRASGILTEIRANLGERRVAWTRSRSDWAVFWNSAARPNRAHQLLMNQAWASERAGLDYAALALRRGAAREIARAGNRLVELNCHLLIAATAVKLSDTQTARQALQAADALSLNIGSTDASRPRRAALITLADAYLQSGDPAGSLRILNRVQSDPGGGTPSLMDQRFQDVHGRTLMRLGQWDQARAVLERETEIIDGRLQTAVAPQRRFREQELAPAARKAVDLALHTGASWPEAYQRWAAHQSASPPQRMPAGEAALVYLSLDTGVVAWLIDETGVTGTRINAPAPELSRSIEEFRTLCSDPDSSSAALQTAARQIHRWLIQPFENRLKNRARLVIEADQWLGRLPFLALQDSSGAYLGHRHATVQTDSLARYNQRRTQPQADASLPLDLILNPLLHGELARLYPPLTVVPGLITFHGPWQTRIHRGGDATAARLKQSLASSGIVHFWGHGAQRAGSSTLLLAPAAPQFGAEFLGAADLADGPRNCRLLVLNACSIADGPALGSEANLIRALLLSGIRNVVAARWEVDASATLALMEHFYAHLAKGVPVSAALAGASRELSRSPETAHPYFWAAFENFGAP